jgi:histidinol-phosphatase (PHP family)
MIDYHVHSDYSQDAEGSVFDYCRRAQELGLEEICFTPHFEIDPARRELDDRVRLNGQWAPMMSDWIDHYVADIVQARREYAPMKVRLGLEAGYDPSIEAELADFLGRHPFDYVLGSIHCIDHVAITAQDPNDFYYSQATAQQATAGYFDLLRRAIDSELFDAIGHIDVFKRYSAPIFGNQLVEMAEPLWPEIFKRIVAHPPLTIEINTSGLLHACLEPYPSERVLRVARDAGLKHVTLGADAHRLKHLGYGLVEGERLAQQVGMRIARYERRRML